MNADICRLCAKTNTNLIWIFDKRIAKPENMQVVIAVTTGVEIRKDDEVTQMVCSKCCQITLKMYKFRTTAMQNDEDLKKGILNNSKLNKSTNKSQQGGNLHKSVLSIYKRFPSIRIPAHCLSNDFDPLVVIKKIKMPEVKTNSRQVACKKTYSQEGIQMLINKSKRPYNDTEDTMTEGKKIKLTSPKDTNKTKTLNNSVHSYETENLLLASKPPMQTHICNICNKVSYNMRELNKHQRQHLRCPVCKKIFRTFEKKDQHYNFECPIKIMMNNLPVVQLERVENNVELKLRYADSFAKTNLLPPTDTTESTEDIVEIDDDIIVKNSKSKSTRRIDDSSDDETVIEEILEPETLDSSCIEITDNVTTPIITEVHSVPIENLDASAIVHINTITTESSVRTLELREPFKKSDNSSSVQLKPLICIDGVQFMLNMKCSEIRIVKNLLKQCTVLFSKKETSSQTEIPSNTSLVEITENSCELQYFRRFLQFYKIPVCMAFGKFHIRVDMYPMFEDIISRKMQLWENEVVVGAKPVLNLKPRPPVTPQGNQLFNGQISSKNKLVTSQSSSVLKPNLNIHLNNKNVGVMLNSPSIIAKTPVTMPSVPQIVQQTVNYNTLQSLLNNTVQLPIQNINVQSSISVASATYSTSVLNQTLVQNSTSSLLVFKDTNTQTVKESNLPIVPNVNILNGKTPRELVSYFQATSTTSSTSTSTVATGIIDLTNDANALKTSTTPAGYLRVKNIHQLT